MMVATATITSNPTARVWSGGFRRSEEKGEGEFVFLLSVASKTGLLPPDPENQEVRNKILQVNPQETAEKIFTSFLQGFELLKSDSPADRLKQAMRGLPGKFNDVEINALSCLIIDGFVYFYRIGTANVWMVRDGEIYELFAGKKKGLSGRYRNKDLYILGTAEFFSILRKNDVKKIFQKESSVQELADQIRPFVQSSQQPSAACILLEIKPSFASHPFAPSQPTQPRTLPIVTDNKSRIFFKLKNLTNTALKKLAQKLPEREMVVRPGPESRRRTALGVGLVLLLTLLLTIGFGLRQKKISDYKAVYIDKLKKAERLYEDAILQKEVGSPTARELFLQASQLVDELKKEGVKDDDLDKLSAQINENKSFVLGLVEEEPKLLLDISLIRAEVRPVQIEFNNGLVGVFDSNGARVILFNPEGKEIKVVGGRDSLINPSKLALFKDSALVLSDDGIVRLFRNGQIQKIIDRQDWGSVIRLGTFGANVYLLTKEGEIWRYPAITGGYGARQRWLGKGVAPDFSDAIDWAIDGSIWILYSSGKIEKFTRGASVRFTTKGTSQTLRQPSAFYTDEQLDSVFILDKETGRIVEFSKDGQYIREFLNNKIQQATDFVVTPTKILLLVEDKVLELPYPR